MTDIKERSFDFAVRTIKMVEALPKSVAGYAIGNQVVRSGTAVGAILEEASTALSYADFLKDLRQARKEAKETKYWLRLISAVGLLPAKRMDALIQEISEIVRIISQSIKTAETRSPKSKITRRKQ